MLNLTSTTDVTFFGWLNQEGSPRVGLLRGAVLSPLGVSEDTTVMSSEARSSIETVQKKLAARVQKKAQEKARLVAQSASLLPWAFWFSWIGARDLLGWGGGANFEG